MVAQCPNCLKDFVSPWAVTRHLSQPLTSCLQWIDQLESASQILLDPEQADEWITESPPDQTPSPYHDFQMDLESEALPGQDIDIPVNNPDYPYSDEGVAVNLESDVLGSGAESLSGQALEPKVFIERFKGAAKVYQRSQTFQDWFNMDAYATHRKENIYYPFASLQDWELGSFLLCSSLSMAAIDQFLGLKLFSSLSRLEHYHSPFAQQKISEARLVHQCLDIILEPLKQAARIRWMMSDPLGNLRYCLTPLASYIVDTPEACMLACVRGKTSPVTLAMYKEFRDTFRHPPRTAKLTLDQLASITCDPLNVEGYFDECSLFHLSSVFLPFWRNWPLADPSWFLTPEALHHWHCEFYDHDVKWCLRAVGMQELDFRFSDGISNLKQVTGRAQCDMQRYMVALIADAAPPGIIIAVRALMDFQYLSQATMIDELHCGLILDALKQFHDHKHEVIACGACRGTKSNSILDNWYIPKLELMQSVTLVTPF
ncbi:hypothetical protein F4604DRAFT_1931671 [Suillus subluteus]|nr:hypothetical protein F4604DRAFT_1931671 [Suillus subluteus]